MPTGRENGLKISVVGATGAVGRELLATLEARRFPVDELLLFASSRAVPVVPPGDGPLPGHRSVRAARARKLIDPDRAGTQTFTLPAKLR